MDVSDVAAYFYEACCLFHDPNIDPENHEAVIDAALLSSDCDDFAWIMSKVTGWPAITWMWNMGDCLTGHHSVVKAPDGRYLDITGWTKPEETAERARIEPRLVVETEFRHHPFFSEEREDETVQVLLHAGAALGRKPFTCDWMRERVDSYLESLDAIPNVPPIKALSPNV